MCKGSLPGLEIDASTSGLVDVFRTLIDLATTFCPRGTCIQRQRRRLEVEAQRQGGLELGQLDFRAAAARGLMPRRPKDAEKYSAGQLHHVEVRAEETARVF